LSEEELLASGIKKNTIRLSVGTEHIDDLLNDIGNAFTTIEGGIS
jgi:O-acetylhomoserine (thiol)-lyase